jgi:plastocyanin
MRASSHWLALFLTLAASGVLVSCAGPPTSRTGAVHDVRVTEGPDPADLIVNPGDEVRWVNSRSLPIRVDLVNVNSDGLSCERGFSNFLGIVRESATIKPNETVSACFTKPGVVNYNLRMDSALPGGRVVTPGIIRVGTSQGTGMSGSVGSSATKSTTTTTTTTITTPSK